MSLTIHVADRQVDWPFSELRLLLEDDGVYWYFHPYFDALREATGQYIDPYGGAWFYGDDLDRLANCLREVRLDAMEQPNSWEQHVGDPEGPPVTQLVHRGEVLNLLDQFSVAVADARQSGRGIVCAGD